MISEEKKEGFFPIDVDEYNGKEKVENSRLHIDKLETDKWIKGKVSAENEIYFNVIQIALSTY